MMSERLNSENPEAPQQAPLFLEHVGIIVEGRNEGYAQVLAAHREELTHFLNEAGLEATPATAVEIYADKLEQVADLSRLFRYCLPYVEDYTRDQVEKFSAKLELVERLIWQPDPTSLDPELASTLGEIQTAYRRYLEQFAYPEYRRKFFARRQALETQTVTS